MDTTDAYLINCRLCANSLTKGKKILIFDANCIDDQSSELCDTIHNCLEIQVSKTDDLPKMICFKCFRMINSIKTFKRKCHRAELQLRKKLLSSIKEKQCQEELDRVKRENEGDNISENNPISFISSTFESVEDDVKVEDQRTSFSFDADVKDEPFADSPAEDTSTAADEPELNKPIKKSKRKSKAKQKSKTKKEPIIDDDFPKIVKKRKRVKTVNVCEVCGIFTKRLSEHMTVHLKIRFNCPMCSKSYPHKATLWRHLLTHNDKKFSCEHCAMRFTCHDYLKRHLLVHTGERNHVCDICNKAFQTKYNLKTHMRTHTKEKPFVCPNCSDAFAHRAAYNTHTRDCNKYVNNTDFGLAI